MSTNILNDARIYLVNSLKGKQKGFETKHPWRNDWEFAVLHSLRVESYALQILARENHPLSEHEIVQLRLAAILHDIARFEKRRIMQNWEQKLSKNGFAIIQTTISTEVKG